MQTAFSRQIILQASGSSQTVHHCRRQGCDFSSLDVLEFLDHNRSQHRDKSLIVPRGKGKSRAPKTPLVCEVCGYVPKSLRLLTDHQNGRHNGLRAHKCCFCEYDSAYYGDIRTHMNFKHSDLVQEIKIAKEKKKQMKIEAATQKQQQQQQIQQQQQTTTLGYDVSGMDPKTLTLSNFTLSGAHQGVNQQFGFIPTTQGYGYLLPDGTLTHLQPNIIYLQTPNAEEAADQCSAQGESALNLNQISAAEEMPTQDEDMLDFDNLSGVDDDKEVDLDQDYSWLNNYELPLE